MQRLLVLAFVTSLVVSFGLLISPFFKLPVKQKENPYFTLIGKTVRKYEYSDEGWPIYKVEAKIDGKKDIDVFLVDNDKLHANILIDKKYKFTIIKTIFETSCIIQADVVEQK